MKFILSYVFVSTSSSDFGVDHSYGGAPKVGSTRRLAGRAKVSISSQIRAAEEGAASRRGGLGPRQSKQ